MKAAHWDAIEKGVAELIDRIVSETGESVWYIARLVEVEAEHVRARAATKKLSSGGNSK